MARHRHDDPLDTLLALGVIFLGIPVAITVVSIVVAGCFTVIWHIGHWVNWW